LIEARNRGNWDVVDQHAPAYFQQIHRVVPINNWIRECVRPIQEDEIKTTLTTGREKVALSHLFISSKVFVAPSLPLSDAARVGGKPRQYIIGKCRLEPQPRISNPLFLEVTSNPGMFIVGGADDCVLSSRRGEYDCGRAAPSLQRPHASVDGVMNYAQGLGRSVPPPSSSPMKRWTISFELLDDFH
jgi:hypothetical protein